MGRMAHRVEMVLIRSTTIVIHPAPNENAWLRGPGGTAQRIGAAARACGTGRGERSQADRGDLNVPLRLECALVGKVQWLELVG